ncbi:MULTISPECIES: GFA family protein [unclassified Aureimonas]|uniref:GFA family protein n=1 Tax=unclassified Aureimonas TaxID=2615206 RepID=UPI0007012055|nr:MULTISPECIES: GFA family protein [unclassified Aureimonas]KQT55331.1 aldehyde-activating protein [Aureimonas sp. Leaf427]KQT71122.1 aldehyde-activating protein [Aureimonas sp. Leaf460]
MSLDNRPLYTGGCQCGAVRFRIEGALGRASICHCRMCQKAFGAFYAPLVGVEAERLAWTRGSLSHFRSSDAVSRGFCSACGTPLTYEAPDGLSLAIGAFDDPSAIAPVIQFGTEARIGYVDRLHELPARDTMEGEDGEDAPAFLASFVSYQHPDHDTDLDWKPKP